MVQDTDNLEMPIDKSNGLILLTEEQANYIAHKKCKILAQHKNTCHDVSIFFSCSSIHTFALLVVVQHVDFSQGINE